MKNAPKPQHLSLQSLVNHLREGRYVIPDFQREFEWEPKDILELMRSLFLDYYVGSLLLWKGRADTFESLKCQPLEGFPDSGQHNPEHIVLDGQQRLSAMYYAFMAPRVNAPNRKARYLYFIRIDKFVTDEPDEAFIYSWTRWGENLLDNRDAQFAERLFPLANIGGNRRTLPFWFKDYEAFWARKHEKEEAQQAIDQGREFEKYVYDLLDDYRVAYIELDQDLEIDKVCDTFTRINTRGIRLDVFDLMNALLRPQEVGLKDMWREVAPDLEFIRSGTANVYVLQVMSLLAQDYCSPKYIYYLLPGAKRRIRAADGSLTDRVLVAHGREFTERWSRAVDIIKRGILRLSDARDFGAISPRFLPYMSIVPAFSAALHAAETAQSSNRLAATSKVRDWYWASVFTNRYSGSVESTTARDVLDVKQWIEDDEARPDVINEFSAWLGTLDLRAETRIGRATYNGVLDLLILNGARDWALDVPPRADDVDDHHIIPKSWGRANGLGNRIDSILNRTPLSSETNRVIIGSRHPNEYLREWVEQQSEHAVRTTLRTHLISDIAFDILRRDPFGEADFEEFLKERQHVIKEAIHNLLIRGRLDLTPDLRELDGRIEAVELELRRRIERAVHGDETQLPPHVRANIKERIDRALRKQPGLGAGDFERLERRLEYADLRELEAVVGKALWADFKPIFGTPPQVQQRFAQLGELRNAIRHSRTASPVTKKDGEAAVLWFEQALGIRTP